MGPMNPPPPSNPEPNPHPPTLDEAIVYALIAGGRFLDTVTPILRAIAVSWLTPETTTSPSLSSAVPTNGKPQNRKPLSVSEMLANLAARAATPRTDSPS